MVKEIGRKLIAQNKSARHDYFIEDVWECGLVLTGTGVKSLRAGRASLIDGFAMMNHGELWLSNVHIPEYNEGTWNNHAPRRDRKLLMHKKEINKIAGIIKQGGLTLVPLSLYFKDGKAKVDGIVLGRVDLTGSLGLSRDDINTSPKIIEICRSLFTKAKSAGLETALGGGVYADTLPFIEQVGVGLVDRFETRQVIFQGVHGKPAADALRGILKAVRFVLMWLKNKRDFYG